MEHVYGCESLESGALEASVCVGWGRDIVQGSTVVEMSGVLEGQTGSNDPPL